MRKRVLCSVAFVIVGIVLLIVNANRGYLGITESGMITIVRVYAVSGIVLAALSEIFKKKGRSKDTTN